MHPEPPSSFARHAFISWHDVCRSLRNSNCSSKACLPTLSTVATSRKAWQLVCPSLISYPHHFHDLIFSVLCLLCTQFLAWTLAWQTCLVQKTQRLTRKRKIYSTKAHVSMLHPSTHSAEARVNNVFFPSITNFLSDIPTHMLVCDFRIVGINSSLGLPRCKFLLIYIFVVAQNWASTVGIKRLYLL